MLMLLPWIQFCIEERNPISIISPDRCRYLNNELLSFRHSGTMSHLQQLLLLLPSLRQADNVVRKFWTKIFTDGSINMNKLLIEMLESVV